MAADENDRGDVLWLRDRTARSPRRAEPLTQERIVAAVVAELDAHGAERLTMRRLAQRLDVTSTALYWHVSTKEDLLDLALDDVVGEGPIPEPGPDPRAAARDLLLGWRAAMLAHPWSPGLLGRPLLGPNVLARTEFLQAMLSRAGLSGIDLEAATRTLSTFVIGSAMADATWRRLDEPAVLAAAKAHIAGRAELYPTLAASGFVDRAWSDDDVFRLGLDRLLAALMPGSGDS
ncbi:TetR/AcrR family transcriptional regulator [Actinomycetospora endophytica]|uniref:TetR/AcrR family transcriptional regulator n=1 Tax=Actinomycetospora endophytica TaxID=2291215 RepID=A0ABS8P903_9PSEU|nr:TetR family transcriptional regulator [Actinomycetospora endophytica]MCD2194584.1 TetR/AcrR family transcriptional regulator [Actinomycetospora endophytica]